MTVSLLSSTTSLVLAPDWWPPPICLVWTPTCSTLQFDTAFASSFLEASTWCAACGSDVRSRHSLSLRRCASKHPLWSRFLFAHKNRKAAFSNPATSLRRSPLMCFVGPLCWRGGRPRSRWHSRGLRLRCDILPTRRLPRPCCRPNLKLGRARDPQMLLPRQRALLRPERLPLHPGRFR